MDLNLSRAGAYFYICVYSLSHLGDAVLLIRPSNTTAQVGHRVQFNCSTNPGTRINWQHIPVDRKYPIDVFIYGILVSAYESRFQIDGDQRNGVYNLVISSLQLSDAGIFRCFDDEGTGEQSDVTLTVTESTDLQLSPKKAEVKISGQIEFTCTTYYKTELINWQRIPMGDKYPTDVYFNGMLVNGYASSYAVVKDGNSSGTYRLIIRNASLEDAGLFRCIDKEGNGQQIDSQLTVTGHPQCQPNQWNPCLNENLTATCTVVFSGSNNPLVQWIDAKGDVINGGIPFVNNSLKVTSLSTPDFGLNASFLQYVDCLVVESNTSCRITFQHCTNAETESTMIMISAMQENATALGQVQQNENLVLIALILIPVAISIAIFAFVIYKKRRKESNHNTEQTGRELERLNR